MDQEHKNIITRNLVQLVDETDLHVLIPELHTRQVFTELMMEKYENELIPLSERKRELYLDLQRRGPEAFNHLISSLLRTGHHDLVRRLQPDLDIRECLEQRSERNRQGTTLSHLPGYLSEVQHELYPRLQTLAIQEPQSVVNLGTEPFKVKVTKATVRRDVCNAKGVPIYPMGSRPKGHVLLINNVEFIENIEKTRIGSQVDEKNVQDLFEQLGYKIIPFRNQGLMDMKRKITSFAQSPVHSHCDSCVVVIMSHGREGYSKNDNSVVTVEGQVLKYEWIIEQFTNINAQYLRNKPKIFIFQTCRGDEKDYGVKMTLGRVQTDGGGSVTIRSMSDILIGYSTLPGFESNRDIHLGTWYIQAICEVFMENAHDTDIEDMLKMVDQKLASLISNYGTMQTTSYENRGFRKFYFNPGLYNETSGSGDTSI